MNQPGLHIIIGLGASGFSALAYLYQKKTPVLVMDTRLDPPFLNEAKTQFPDVTIQLGELNQKTLLTAACVVISPGMSVNLRELKAVKDLNIPIIGDVELFAREVTAPVIAITGTNAKSTVTTLVGEMATACGLKVAVGGNLGVPTLDLLNPEAELYVLELSSFQLETSDSLKPVVASVLNVTEDHMDRYPDLAAYTAAKQRIYEHAQKIVCNADDDLTDFPHANKTSFSIKQSEKSAFHLMAVNGEPHLAHHNTPLLAVSALYAHGKHDQANALAALAIIHAYSLPLEPAIDVLKNFKGLPHRCQLVRELNQVKWVNDSKGTNVGATLAAIQGLGDTIKGRIVLIAGGLGKDADFSPLLPVFKKFVRHVVLIGEAANELHELMKHDVPTSFAGNMQEAVMKAHTVALPQDIVLLSPACASLDMFKNYAHRGDVFAESVMSL